MTEYTKEQQAEHRKQWVEALRSGKYQQTKNALRDGAGFCCLGVACDISGVGSWDEDGDHKGRLTYRADNARADVLPIAVQKWLGLKYCDSSFDDEQLSAMNDSGVSFDRIADIIESEPEGLLAK